VWRLHAEDDLPGWVALAAKGRKVVKQPRIFAAEWLQDADGWRLRLLGPGAARKTAGGETGSNQVKATSSAGPEQHISNNC
jgi:hypothetical protein